MAKKREKVCFEKRDSKGSRLRCLLVTHQIRPEVVAFLNSVVNPIATVGDADSYMPAGFCKPNEAKLGETIGFLDGAQRQSVTDWWLEVIPNANTPNWDIVSTCSIEQRPGLLLVEAKAYEGELSTAGKKPPKTANGQKNHNKIGQAIAQATSDLNSLQLAGNPNPSWALSRNHNYQLSNRFAWAGAGRTPYAAGTC